MPVILDIDTVRIKMRHRFEPQAPGQELSVLLETGDGEPLVVENYLGRGRIIFQALPFDVGWGLCFSLPPSMES